MAIFDFTYPQSWAANRFETVPMAPDYNLHPLHPLESRKGSFFCDNGRGTLCAVKCNYLGTLCINEVYWDHNGIWRVSRRATYTLHPEELQQLLETGTFTYGWDYGERRRDLTMRLLTEEEAQDFYVAQLDRRRNAG